jgi:hypothetical protein
LEIFKTFDLDPISLNQKIQKRLYFSFVGPSQFGLCSLEAHLLFPVFFSFFRPAITTAHLGPPGHGGSSSLLAHFLLWA